MEWELAFGKGHQILCIPDRYRVTTLRPNAVEAGLTGEQEIIRALQNPAGTPRLCEIVKPGEKVAIVTSDITRPMPARLVLPHVIDELRQAGTDLSDITVVFAVGSHRRHTPEEMRYLAGDIYGQVRCIDSDPEDCECLGVTSAGTPVDIFSEVARAERIVCLGNVEYHYFAGYSGGAKAIMPGVSTRAAIQANHSQMVHPHACTGRIEDNPVRWDIEEAAKFAPIDFIVNVVLDEKKEIVRAEAGHYIHAHRMACRYLDAMYKTPIPAKADIVVVSPGGYPKDINLYQAQKALDNAKYAVKKRGTIILAASCSEGLGEAAFERWMTRSPSPECMIREIQRRFELGGHKAAAIAMVLRDSDVYLVSDLADDFVRRIFLTPYRDVQSAFDAAAAKQDDPSVIVMPYGGSTLPVVLQRRMTLGVSERIT
jgi:nickel-dependent lactate racemase